MKATIFAFLSFVVGYARASGPILIEITTSDSGVQYYFDSTMQYPESFGEKGKKSAKEIKPRCGMSWKMTKALVTC